MSERPLPPDHEKRTRFVLDTDRSLSVHSPAGSGKTHAIVQRILTLLRKEDPRRILKRLCVVTYTERAANEMRTRARAAALKAGVSRQSLQALDEAFFGTIHALCASLIRQYGYFLGVPARLEVAENLLPLWRSFLTTDKAGQAIADAQVSLREVSRDLSIFTILEKIATGKIIEPVEAGDRPEPDFSALLSYVPKSARGAENVEKGKQIIREWMANYESGQGIASIPRWSLGGADFVSLWTESFRPLKVWIAQKAAAAAYRIGLAFQEYRIFQGSITFDDQVHLAASLLRNPDACERIHKNKLLIILDEAQDTDPLQFEVLLRLAGGSFDIFPDTGRFTMVGDPQQSIYGDRADVGRYMSLHDLFVRRGDHVVFDVTFRCSRKVIQFANHTFPFLLDGLEEQASYVPLIGCLDATEGNVSVLEPDIHESDTLSDVQKAHAEAKWLAAWLASTGFKALGARSWEEVAILCPRNLWLTILEEALRDVGLQAQVHSMRATYSDRAPYAWLAAVVSVLSNPTDSFETVGVLREVFGISDEELALYAARDPKRFHLNAGKDVGKNPQRIPAVLKLLGDLRREIRGMPLRCAMDVVLERLRFRDRLLSLPDSDAEEVDRAFRHLLSEASNAERDGKLLPEFSRHLRRLLDVDVQAIPPHPDAIQLLNSKKAKGGEWDAVIVPFLWRKITTKREVSALSTDLIADIDKETRQQKERQELIRLLYVTMTRPRHSLFLIDDRKLFLAKKESTTTSFAELMGEGVLDEVKTWRPSDEVIQPVGAPVSQARKQAAFPSIQSDTFEKAGNASRQITHRVLPHELASHGVPEDPEYRMEDESVPFSSEGALYGTWWHETMRWIPWSEGRAAWAMAFEQAAAHAPSPDRAKDEWRKFQASPLADLLDDADAVIHTEIPFLSSEAQGQCMEGIIDMAIWKTARDGWIVVDWKTDRESSADLLLSRYGGQIEAYKGSLMACTGKLATGGIYSTVLGSWLPLDGFP